MSDLTPDEMKEYKEITDTAAKRPLTPKEAIAWQDYGQRYAVQLEREGREYRAKRAEQMEQFLAEKREWSVARDAARDAGEDFAVPEPERDFNAWLTQKGLA